jgi:4-amino-4-deoxy-L-arabinose transferase-like glycosyltransferase
MNTKMRHPGLNLTALTSAHWAVLTFVLALAPRLPGLRIFLTSDEHTNLYWAGSQFVEGLLSGNLSLTYWHFYPGVTMSWLETAGLAAAWALERLSGSAAETLAQFVRRPILDLIVAARLPYALLTAAVVTGFYLMARRLLGHRTALLGALFIAFDPFFLAHSRVAHGDASVAAFMGLSALALFVYLQAGENRRRWLVLSAVLGGLAALTKAPGQLMAPFVILVGVGDWLLKSWRAGRPDWRLAGHWLVDLTVWGGVAAFLFVALWPAMWVDPAGVIARMVRETFGKVEEGHLVFFMGQPALDPGPWFYPYVTFLRLTPVTLIGMLACGILLIIRLGGRLRKKAGESGPADTAAALLWLFVAFLLLSGDLSPKKQDRYLLPLFPILDMLAAFVYVEFGRYAMRGAQYISRARHYALRIMALSLLAFHALPVVTVYPYYLAYFNPLLGGLPRAVETTLVGWGEGMEQVAAYLNQQPDAERLYVASVPSQTLLPYFKGTGENFYTNDVALRADRVVLYISEVQRLAPSPEIVRYFRAMEPEHIVYVEGAPYAWIYSGPKLITADVPPGAQLANVGLGDQLRLAGYQISDGQITLYWHALAKMETDYTVSVRLVGPDGAWLAQGDSWPANGLLPTSQWRQGDYVKDDHSLAAPAGAVVDHVQVVIYNAASGQPLGAPIDLPLNR